MTKAEILEELAKCQTSPYYFMTHYWKVDGKLFTTLLTEDEFNRQFAEMEEVMYIRQGSLKHSNN